MARPAELGEQTRRALKRLAHHLKPVVQTGAAGLTPALIAEINHALDHHELIKVKLVAADREARNAMATEISRQTGAWLIQRIGSVGTFYRENTDNPTISQSLT